MLTVTESVMGGDRKMLSAVALSTLELLLLVLTFLAVTLRNSWNTENRKMAGYVVIDGCTVGCDEGRANG